MVQWIKKKWSDSVWSKVFAGIILAILTGIIGLIISFFEQISLADLYDKARTNYIQVSYIAIAISFIVLLSLILPVIIINIICFQLKPTKHETEQFNLHDFLKGQWRHTYKSPENEGGEETVIFSFCFRYHANNKKWAFILTDIEFDINSNKLKWTKIKSDTKEEHGTEMLDIIDNNTIRGKDMVGYVMTYTRITNKN